MEVVDWGDHAEVRPCRDENADTCQVVRLAGSNNSSRLVLPSGGRSLPSTATYQQDRLLVHRFGAGWEGEAVLCQVGDRLAGWVRHQATTAIIEPCNNFPGCHVWKVYPAEAWLDETEVPAPTLPLPPKPLSAAKSTDDIAEFSLKLYYTNQFLESTDDVELYAETIIADMNIGYEDSKAGVRVRLHCTEHADLQDEAESRDMLHVFNQARTQHHHHCSIFRLMF